MPLLENERLHCEQCGALLEEDATTFGCLNCLLGGGLSESGAENRRFQHYELCLRADGITLDELGRGAMGVTYRAFDLNLDSPVALKVISAAYSDKPEARERFRHEARAAAQLRHPNVASVFYFGETAGGQFFYAMELVEGETLEARVHREGSLTLTAALEVLEQVCRALIAAESHRLVHRDLKPSNLMVVSNEFSVSDTSLVKVIDFGLAQAVVALQEDAVHPSFSGTPEFASPEQFTSTASLDARSDIYSLGATFWYLLCGRALFTDNQLAEMREQKRQLPVEQLTAAKMPAPVARLLCSMLATEPEARPQSARELLVQIRGCREAVELRPRRRRTLTLTASALALIALSAFGLTSHLSHRRQPLGVSSPVVPERSIAVLPFENLSDDKEHAFFADGIQDDILIKLAKIADLKVISRTSVMQYRGKQDVRQIGNALSVSHVLEGTVRRSGGRLHVNAELVDTRTDSDIWAEEYDRDLNDVFAIETEVAQSIANRLRAKVSTREKVAMQERPTKDLVAYDLYVRAASLIDKAAHLGFYSKEQEKDYFQAIELLNQAIARDTAFLFAYCRLAEAHDEIYFDRFDYTPRRLELAKSAINSAFRLKPDSGEAHLALATHLYHGYRDYDHARNELAIALRTLPNNARIFEWSGYIDRRQSRWHDAVRDFQRATKLDPRNPKILTGAAVTYELMRNYGQARQTIDRLIALEPNNIDHRLRRAAIEVSERADIRPVQVVLEKMSADDPASAERIASGQFFLALCERDAVAADRALAALRALGEDTFDARYIGGTRFSRAYLEGLVARMKGDAAAARAAFSFARAQEEEAVRVQPDYGPPLCVLGLIDAALGRKEEALRESRRALELAPIAKDSLDGADVLYFYAVICAWTGEHDLAIEQLETLAKIPGSPSYGDLRLNPNWDLLRSDPRFEKIAVSLLPTP